MSTTITRWPRDKEKFQEGLEQGELNKSLEVAKNLIGRGLDNQFILETTGLSMDVIQRLRNDKDY